MAIPNYIQLTPGENGTGRRNPEEQKQTEDQNSNYNLMQQQLITELQRVISDKGMAIPQVDAATVILLNTISSKGSILFNKSTGKFMGNEDGIFKTFTTS